MKTTLMRLSAALALAVMTAVPSAMARDTDIYQITVKQNAFIVLDTSGSMRNPVYEHTIDYRKMYDALKNRPSATNPGWRIAERHGAQTMYPRDRIYMVKNADWTKMGLQTKAGGVQIAFPGDPVYTWWWNPDADTRTRLDQSGNLAADGGAPRLGTDSDGHVLFDGRRLPYSLDIQLHNYANLSDGSQLDNGFAGALKAPGFYCSGYREGNGTLQKAGNRQAAYLFVTGNWLNFQKVYGFLYYQKIANGAWAPSNRPIYYSHFYDGFKSEPYPLTDVEEWPQLDYSLAYPGGGENYKNNLSGAATSQTVAQAGATKMQVHFAAFDVKSGDKLKLCDQNGVVKASYDNGNPPPSNGWSATIAGSEIKLILESDASGTGLGYTIDKIRYITGDNYYIQGRLDIAKEALEITINNYGDDISWGFSHYKSNADGAVLEEALDPAAPGAAKRSAVIDKIKNSKASGGTPTMEAQQDALWFIHSNRGKILNVPCRKTFIVHMTDGYPSADEDNKRLNRAPFRKIFSDEDGDGWTQDPVQTSYASKPDYYDDVCRYMYTHSFVDGSVIADPTDSYYNLPTHSIAFGGAQPLLQDAAKDGGGLYLQANNKAQLVAAFSEIANQAGSSTAFSSPALTLDAADKLQSGDDVYMGLFLPWSTDSWAGNLKKFKMGNGSAARPDASKVYDKNNALATGPDGKFLDKALDFWGNSNFNSGASSSPITNDGAGEVMLQALADSFEAGKYWTRPIYTWKGGSLVRFNPTNITADDLGVGNNSERDRIINYTHGYTYAAKTANSAPEALRPWPMGAIIHSQPIAIDYYDTSKSSLPLLKRYVAVGSNGGMLHVFDDDTGAEVFSFIPPDILPKLKELKTAGAYVDTVDGPLTLYRRDSKPQYLIFGERRGGGHYWALKISEQDPSQWTVAWDYTNPEIAQSWSEVQTARIPVSVNSSTGVRTYKDVAIFSGGYDPQEDSYPEPFDDKDGTGTPFDDSGNLKAGVAQDVNGNGQYDLGNPDMDSAGRGIFVVDIDNPSAVTSGPVGQLLPFSVTYGTTDQNSGALQTRRDMKFAFPATPSLLTRTDRYTVVGHSGTQTATRVLDALYTPDIYANLYKVRLDLAFINSGTAASPSWQLSGDGWTVDRIFSSNPGTGSSSKAGIAGTLDAADQGRKAFYAPTISRGGTEKYFEGKFFRAKGAAFNGRDGIASLFFGTGDREHPKYSFIRNRIYAIYDDTSLSATRNNAPMVRLPVSSAPYTEQQLMNLSCDELGKDSIINSCYLGNLGGTCTAANASESTKAYLRELLVDDGTYSNGTTEELEEGALHEDDSKGWYIMLDAQGDPIRCSHMQYASSIDAASISSRDNHKGEQVLSKPALFYGTLYFTTYQTSGQDSSCAPIGNAFTYALRYENGSATYDYVDRSLEKKDITDRYWKYSRITGIPSSPAIYFRNGEVYAVANIGDRTVGMGYVDPKKANDQDALPGPKIHAPGAGLQLFYWRDSNSQKE